MQNLHVVPVFGFVNETFLVLAQKTLIRAAVFGDQLSSMASTLQQRISNHFSTPSAPLIPPVVSVMMVLIPLTTLLPPTKSTPYPVRTIAHISKSHQIPFSPTTITPSLR
jgi:hypothetical protein